ncbi:bifunctional allantoicase/(S)-ureidoglycine aminohydrolase [Jannaschia sp. W003]|uniref:bifunctional allantoicase/(S)-ureidoglycine aminohydrolase n=1 Tax=Jannaschia sp. W003 TaxID=2867012 RepID=UPI0021A32658|nr:bifunctional allantoicase/(S)-ureidoglycine aminohydrolase [Jannaschia sp. W003]UWQ20155.1 (S)-ureidoglycine aminohydrolase [Jannaschia sp. W003]
MTSLASPPGGLPPQSQLLSGRARFTESYAVIPRGVQSDIVTSFLPGWEGMRMWVLARPLSGFAETFFQAAVELEAGGGSDRPEQDPGAEGVVFVTRGALSLSVEGTAHALPEGGYAFLPAGCRWTVRSERGATFQWVRRRFEAVEGLDAPEAFVAHEGDEAPIAMPGTDGGWTTRRFVDPGDLRHDMHVNIVSLAPGAVIPFLETHVMEHGLYVLEGKAVYALNRDWVEVEAGDFMWLRAFCPQACYAGGPGPFRYLLYKDVNRMPGFLPA